MSEHIQELKDEEKQAIQARGRDGWIPGLILIGLGTLFLFSNVFNMTLISNWWAIFILIPAFSKLNCAWQEYRRAGTWTDAARSALVGGALIGTVALIFLFGLSWGTFWPVLLVIFGLGILLRGA
jgi:hypothetical protein